MAAVRGSHKRSESTFLDDYDETIDPRVQIELEKLNNATDCINKLEVELDEARSAFRQLLTESSQRINVLAKKLGNSVERSRPYYEARMIAQEAQLETQHAALRFERANSAQAAAKEMVFLSEEGLQTEGRTFDPAWQEMLNHATSRVNEAERERSISEQEHKNKSKAYNDAEQLVQQLHKDLKKAITKSRPYFEMKSQFNQMLEEQKKRVQSLEESVLNTKQSYADALHNLEEISDEIHRQRQKRDEQRSLGVRGVGVGAESPEPLDNKDGNNEIGNEKYSTNDESTDVFLRAPSSLRLPRSFSSSTVSSLLSNEMYSRLKITPGLRKSMSVETKGVNDIAWRPKLIRRQQNSTDCASQTDSIILQANDNLSSKTEPIITSRGNIVESNAKRNAVMFGDSLPLQIDLSKNNISPGTKELTVPSAIIDNEISDTESLGSIDVLTDEQVANLMLDRDDDSFQDMLSACEPLNYADNIDTSSICKHQGTQMEDAYATC